MKRTIHHPLLWLNYAKAVVIALFVYTTVQRALFQNGYTAFGQAFHIADSVLHSFLIPTFFFITGYYFHAMRAKYRREKFYGFLFDKLVYVFVLWTIIQGVIETAFSGYTGGNALLTDIYYQLIADPQGHLRLLPALAISYLLARLIPRHGEVVTNFALLLVFVPAYIFQAELRLFYPLNLIAEYFCFFLLGLLFHHYRFLFLRHSTPAAIISIALFTVCQYLFHSVYGRESYNPDFYTFCLGVTGIATIAGGCMAMARFQLRPIKHVGKMAMVIFLMHFIVSSGIREILENSFSISNAYLHLAMGIIAGIGVPLVLSKWIYNSLLHNLMAPPSFISAAYLYRGFFGSPLPRFVSIAVLGTGSLFFLTIFIGSSVAVARFEDVPEPSSVALSDDNGSIREGARLAQIFGCFRGCHGNKLEGTVFLRSPLVGIFSAPNLTQSVRKYSVEEIDGIVRQGRWPDGSPVVGGMPSAGFSMLTDSQMGKILSFIQSMPVQANMPPRSSLGVKTRLDILLERYTPQHELIKEANAFFSTQPSPTLQRGQALARSACSECHGHTLQGNVELRSPPLSIVQAYTFDDFSQLMKTGTALGDRKLGLMGVVARNRFSKLKERELRELFEYLNTPR